MSRTQDVITKDVLTLEVLDATKLVESFSRWFSRHRTRGIFKELQV